jgi:hypothetical protein
MEDVNMKKIIALFKTKKTEAEEVIVNAKANEYFESHFNK